MSTTGFEKLMADVLDHQLETDVASALDEDRLVDAVTGTHPLNDLEVARLLRSPLSRMRYHAAVARVEYARQRVWHETAIQQTVQLIAAAAPGADRAAVGNDDFSVTVQRDNFVGWVISVHLEGKLLNLLDQDPSMILRLTDSGGLIWTEFRGPVVNPIDFSWPHEKVDPVSRLQEGHTLTIGPVFTQLKEV